MYVFANRCCHMPLPDRHLPQQSVMQLPGQGRPVEIGGYAEPSRGVGVNKSQAASSDYRPRLS